MLAHILVCFPCEVLWKTLVLICQKAGLGNRLRRVLADFSEIQLILPTREGHEIREQCVTGASEHPTMLRDHRGLKLPARV